MTDRLQEIRDRKRDGDFGADRQAYADIDYLLAELDKVSDGGINADGLGGRIARALSYIDRIGRNMHEDAALARVRSLLNGTRGI